MVKNINIINNGEYIVVAVENLHDLEVFSKTRKYLDHEITSFWQAFARGERFEFALTKAEFKKFYL